MSHTQVHTHPRRTPATTQGSVNDSKGLHPDSAATSARADASCRRQQQPLPQDNSVSLRKGSTFHASLSPPAVVEDPILNVRTLPQRHPTSPKALEDLVAASEKRVAEIIESFDRSFSGLTSKANDDTDDKEVLPVPSFLLAHAASSSGLTGLGPKNKHFSPRRSSSAAKHKKSLGRDAVPAETPDAHKKTDTVAKHKTITDTDDDTSSVDDQNHAFDSGLGSSVASTVPEDEQETTPSTQTRLRLAAASSASSSTTSVYSSLTATYSAINKSYSGFKVPEGGHSLDKYATSKIKLHIINPILQEPNLKEYHPLVEELPQRIEDRAITCLRDLEKTLIFLAPVSADFSDGEGILAHCFLRAKTKASSPASYLEFCEFSIQCIHTTVDHLNDLDQRRPADRPYTNNYFVDLVEQVRQYARIMAVSRQKKAKGEKMDPSSDYTPFVSPRYLDAFFDRLLTEYSGEKLRLRGGASQDGKPAELVREKEDGKIIPIQGGRVDVSMEDLTDDDEDLIIDEDVRRSMARKRKCDQGKEEYRACRECGKLFTRPCDLTKHEKTHSRPWKCSEEDCKYHTLGWPTEKERDRHVNDKHNNAPKVYRCLYTPCAYTSKRESNCKQHMEKAHGWQYVRSKSKKSQSLVATVATPTTPLMPTPSAAAYSSVPTPATSSGSPFGNSPARSASHDFSEDGFTSGGFSNFGASPEDFNMMGDMNGPTINFNDYNGNSLTADGVSFSPAMSEGRRESLLATPGLSVTSGDTAPPPTFEDSFNFADLAANNPWPPMHEFFPQYNMQQPTPAWSDNNFETAQFGANNGLAGSSSQDFLSTFDVPSKALSNNAQSSMGNLMLAQEGGESQFEEFKAFANKNASNGNDDFTLYNDANLTMAHTPATTHNGDNEVAESSAAGAMFPDLGNVGDQFSVGGLDPIYDAMTSSVSTMSGGADENNAAMDQFTNYQNLFPHSVNNNSQRY